MTIQITAIYYPSNSALWSTNNVRNAYKQLCSVGSYYLKKSPKKKLDCIITYVRFCLAIYHNNINTTPCMIRLLERIATTLFNSWNVLLMTSCSHDI